MNTSTRIENYYLILMMIGVIVAILLPPELTAPAVWGLFWIAIIAVIIKVYRALRKW